MNNKHYKSISEVSDLLKINKHVIRYWDSKFEGISTRLSKTKRRFFSPDNIKKIQELKNVLYQNGKQNYTLELANKIVSKKSKTKKDENFIFPDQKLDHKMNIKELEDILINLKKLL